MLTNVSAFYNVFTSVPIEAALSETDYISFTYPCKMFSNIYFVYIFKAFDFLFISECMFLWQVLL